MHPHGHCQICLSYRPISEFKILPCGHGSCNSCFEEVYLRGANKGKCFVCRNQYSLTAGHRIHLDLVDSKVALLANTTEGLEMMDVDVKVISVRRASERITKTAEVLESVEEKDSLQQAIDDFRERIAPAFIKFEAQTKELERLRKELSRVQAKADGFDVMCNESRKKDRQLAELRLKLEQSETHGQNALSVAERCATEIIELKKQVAVERQEKERLEEDNKTVRGMLDRQSKAVTTYKLKVKEHKEKISELMKQNETLLEQSQLEEAASSDRYVRSDYENYSSASHALVHNLSSPERSHRTSGLSQIANELRLGYEDLDLNDGMPGPGFSSDWMTSKPQKRKATSENFPIPLDKRGRPTVSVQTGPVRLRRVPAM